MEAPQDARPGVRSRTLRVRDDWIATSDPITVPVGLTFRLGAQAPTARLKPAPHTNAPEGAYDYAIATFLEHRYMKSPALTLVMALIAFPAHAVEKCISDGKVIYTDQTCASLGAKTQKSFDPPDNTVMSAKTQYLRYKVAKNMPYPSEPPSHNVRQSPTPVASNNQAA